MLLPALIHVLHVDDEESQREFAKMFLEEDGVIQVTSAASGKEALQLLEKESYDCVISDYQMNGMTGIQLAEKIKSHISIPFILYTGRGSEEVAEAAFKVGIDDYIRKEIEPAHYQVLAKNIEHVVERARGVKSLTASEEKFRRFFMNQPVLCCILSKEGNIVEVNDTVTDALGYTREELIGKPGITTLYSPSSRGKAEQLFRRWVETGELRNEELNIVTKTGEERTVLLNVDAVRDASGDVIQSISVQVDITQRRQMEDEARIHHEESERHALILENMSDSVIVTDLDGVISYWNDGAKNIFGYSPEEMIGKSVKLLNLVEERDAVADSQLDAVKRGESYPTEWRGLKKNGSELWLFLHTKLLKDHEGNPVGMIGVGKDITQRKQMEEELRESEERYRTLVENSPNAISVTIGNTIVYANQKRADLAGEKDPSELVVTSALSQVVEGDRGIIIEMMEARERGEEPPSPLEYRMLRADGSVRDIVDYHSEINYQGTYAVQHVLHDVTDQKRYERRLESLHRHATELGKAGTMDDVAERTLDAIKSVLGYNQGGFGVVEGSVLHFIRMIGVSVGEGFELPLDGKGVTVRAVRTGKTQLVADAGKDENYELGPAGRELKSLSELAVPVKIDGKAVAIINVESEKLDDFNEEDRKLLEIFAEHVASAISGYREEAEHRRYEQSLEALHRNASELQLAGNVQRVCDLTLDAMEQALGLKKVAFLSVEKGILKAIGTRGAPILDIPLPLDGKGVTVKAANTRRTVLVNDLRGDSDFVRGYTDSLSELAAPVLIDGETVAVLNVESLGLNAFTRGDQGLLEMLAQHVASALSRLGEVEVLRASEGRYRTFLESSRDAVFVFDDDVYIYVNRAAVDMLGYDSAEEIIGLPVYSIVAPEEREEVMRRTAARAGGEAVPGMYEVRLLRRDGGVVTCEANASRIMYEGKPVSLSMGRDLIERVKMEERLRESEENYKDLAESISNVFFAMDKDLRYTYWNKASEKLTGVSAKNAIGKSLTEVFPDVKGSKVEQFYLNVLKTKQHQTLINTYRLGEIDFVFEIDAYPTKDGLSVFTKDVTERVNMEKELRGYVENVENRLEEKTKELIEAEAMSAAGKVAAMIGHDLRSPIQAIKSNLYLLRKSPEKAEERLKAIDDAADRMVAMVEELRTKIRDTPVAVQAVDLADLAGLCLKETPVPPDVKTQLVVGAGLDSVTLDPLKMRRVLDNLVRNAVEAMPEGGNLAISAERVGSEAVIKVSDTGVGIPEEAMRRLFKPFYTTKSGGLGLGLAYCKMAVEAHGGSITAESKVGEGTTFTVTLSLHPRAQPKNP